MNVLIANIQEFNPLIGGIEKISTSLAIELCRLGHEVIFVSCKRAESQSYYQPVAPQLFLSEDVLCEKNKNSLKAMIAKYQVEIILNQAGFHTAFSSLLLLVTQECKVPLITAIHTDPQYHIKELFDLKYSKIYPVSYLRGVEKFIMIPFKYFKRSFTYRKAYKQIVDKSFAVVVLSNNYKEYLAKCVGNKSSKKLIVIPNFTEIKSMKSIKKNKILLFVGRLDYEAKRPDRLIEIWEELYGDFPEWELHILGDGPMKMDLECYVQKKGIQHITFMGFRPPEPEYQKASILCSTSTCEGFPMAIVEGMMQGCIPIAFNSYGAVHDLIEDGVNGFLIPKYQKKIYINVLRNLMENKQKRELICVNAQIKAQRFTANNVMNLWTSLLTNATQA